MKKAYLILILFLSISIFSQEKEYSNATNYLYNNQLDLASKIIQSAINKKQGNKSKYYLLYANILKFQNISDSSLHYISKVESDYVNREIKDSLLLTYAIKTEFYRYFGERKKADTCLLNIEKFNLNEIKNKDIVAYALNRKMAILNGYHDWNKDTIKLVNKIAKQIFNLDNQIKNKEIIAYTLNEIAQIEDYKGDKNKAFSKYEAALLYAKKHKLLNPEIDISFNLAKLHATFKNDNSKAAEILESLVTRVEEGSNIRQKFSLFLQLKDYYKAINNNKKALIALENAYHYSQDLNNQQSNLKLNVIERKYDLEKKEKKIKEKENEIIIQNLEIENSKKKFFLILIIFLLTTIGVVTLTFFFRREKKSNKELRLLSSENEFLMSEANHRINNNLQLIIILISDQIEKLKKSESKEIKKVLVKINSIATLHKHLYKSKNKKEINIQNYLKDIENSFSDLFIENNINSNFSVSAISLKVDDTMYLGLMLTELYINSIKHAFKNQEDKQINFSIKLKDNEIMFKYMDNGNNLKNSDSPKPVLIDQLCRQLELPYKIQTIFGFELTFKIMI
ncbi:sensor histidine kinase [Flavobacterium jejuense]|uniref:histidine kinase n=1 Tax=Flavobacterium jejuense TaxID=1544455 RepID=A0ABX0IWP6_9FLAO|nr:sensor histidine kinase [Flavobacterium jejuense]NHN28133.1 sensor histidine kinase [Flavobacterium jejuense]